MKKRLFSLMLAFACLLSLIPLPASAESADEEEFLNITISGTQDYDEILEAYELINSVREDNGIRKLTLDPLLTDNAMQRAAELSVFNSYTRPNGWHYVSGIDLRYDILGFKAHVIATAHEDALSVVRYWMTSSTSLFSETYTTIGIGCFYQGDGTKYWAVYLTDKTIYSQFEKSGKQYIADIPIEVIPDNLYLKLMADHETSDLETYEGERISFQVLAGSAVLNSGYTLSVADTSIVQLDSQANTLTGLQGGTTTLTARIGDVEASVPVSVIGIPETLYLNFGMQDPDHYVLIWPDDQEQACLFGKKAGSKTWTLLSGTKPGFNMYTHYDIPVGEEWSYILRFPWANGTYLDISNEVLLVKLAAPTLSVMGTQQGGLTKLIWDAPAGATSYKIYRGTNANGPYPHLATVTETSYLDTTAENGQTYYYRICALGKGQSISPFSNIVSRTSNGEGLNLKVSNVASSGKPKLTWDKVEGAVKYQVYRATSKAGTYKLLSTTTGTSLTNTSTETGKTYYYKVRAVLDDGSKTKFSSIVSRTCDLPRPVLRYYHNMSTGKNVLKWDEIAGAAKYEVYRSTDNKTWSKLGTTTGNLMTNTSAVAGKTYYYKVKAIHEKSAANSAYSVVQKITCKLPTPEVTIGNVASTGKIKLTWSKIEGAEKYEVYRATSKTGTFTHLYTTTGTSMTNTSAVAGKTYYYTVVAIHKNADANSYSSETVSRTCDLARPTLTVTLNSSGKPVLTWTKVEGAVKYEVYRSTDNKTWTKLYTTTGTKLTNTSGKAGTKYYYKVRAIHEKSAANSAYSTVKSITAK